MNNLVAGTRAYGGDLDGAVEALRKTLEIAPDFGISHAFLGVMYAAQGKYSEALAEYDKSGYGESVNLYRGVTYVLAGRRADAQRLVEQMDQRAKSEYVPPAARGLIWLALGEEERGSTLLAKGCAEQDDNLRDVKVNPLFDRLRGKPRFHEVLKCMRLE